MIATAMALKRRVAFDQLTSKTNSSQPTVLAEVLRNTRSHIMPPPREEQPTARNSKRWNNGLKLADLDWTPPNRIPAA